MIFPVILAGGSGTRLWPLSRQLFPKQLMNLVNENTMLQNTILRLSDFQGINHPIIICNEEHRFMIAEQARRIHINPASIILEPVGRNTAPAVAIAALQALDVDEDPLLVVLPADHHIEDIHTFQQAISIGEHFSREGKLITFGIVPSAPETGYGYIQKGDPIAAAHTDGKAVTIREFVEKPDLKTAEKYLASGNYCWNSGIFMFKALTVLAELKKYVPDMVAACERAFRKGRRDLDFFRLDAGEFSSCPSDSIDYAVMEKTDAGVMIPFDAGWNDLGSWEALWQVGKKDSSQNVIHGDVITHQVHRSYLHSTGRMIAAIGLKNHIVVETADAVLISPMDRVQDVKQIVDQLKSGNRKEALVHRRDYRPWGICESIDVGERFLVNRVTVKPGAKMSLQKHFHRAEHWIVVRGTALVTKGEEQIVLREDQSAYIPVGVDHRLENPGKIPLEIIEVHSGSYLGEEDIVRLEDS
ncbi:MAG: mannose-1-phosphate guanylyltransferase/mannose-6-phosphate isomerase [Deltaproteobacteria bacterium]|nr:MAG: mannose-1-phosphate guanylyltransferase/mannose-6-phosphate isomerase [Deltaproteobacteria bacterium]